MKDYFTLTIPTKPYLAKYLYARYGKPIIFTTENDFGTTLLGFLTKKIYKLKESKIEYRKFDQFTMKIDIYLPSYWLRNYKYKRDITRENIIYLNKHFEEVFEEKLCWHCYMFSLFDIEYKDAIEDFCKRFDIEIDEDITFEALKKKEYRARKHIEENVKKVALPIQPRLF